MKNYKVIISVVNGILCLVIGCLLVLNCKIEKEFSESIRVLNKAENRQKMAIKEEVIRCHNDLQEIVKEVLPGIICWGDSLTAGAGGNGVTYPLILKNTISEKLISDFDVEKLAKKLGGGKAV